MKVQDEEPSRLSKTDDSFYAPGPGLLRGRLVEAKWDNVTPADVVRGTVR
jgi:hypothetical protein